MTKLVVLASLAALLVACGGSYDQPVDKVPNDSGWTDIGNECNSSDCVKQITVFGRKCIVLYQDDGRSGGISCDWTPESKPTP